MSNYAGRAASEIYCWPASRKLWLAIRPELTVFKYVYIYIYIFVYNISYCGLLAVKPVMNIIEQMVGLQSYYFYKMGFNTARRHIFLVEVNETQISLKVLKITDEVKVFPDTGGRFPKINVKSSGWITIMGKLNAIVNCRVPMADVHFRVPHGLMSPRR